MINALTGKGLFQRQSCAIPLHFRDDAYIFEENFKDSEILKQATWGGGGLSSVEGFTAG